MRFFQGKNVFAALSLLKNEIVAERYRDNRTPGQNTTYQNEWIALFMPGLPPLLPHNPSQYQKYSPAIAEPNLEIKAVFTVFVLLTDKL